MNTRIHFGPPHGEYVTSNAQIQSAHYTARSVRTLHSQVGLGRRRIGGLVGVPADGLLFVAGGLQLLLEVQRLVAVDALGG